MIMKRRRKRRMIMKRVDESCFAPPPFFLLITNTVFLSFICSLMEQQNFIVFVILDDVMMQSVNQSISQSVNHLCMSPTGWCFH